MKTKRILFAVLVLFLTVNANSQQFTHANGAGGTGSDRGYDIGTDSNGNMYVCGWFSGTAQFDTETLVSAGENDIFIVTIPGSSQGISGKSPFGQLTVHPNPAFDHLTVHTGNLFQSSGILQYQITDISGKTRLAASQELQTNGEGIIQIDISSLGTGIYLLKIFNKNVAFMGKFVVGK